MARAELEALETTERLPITLPTEFGAKTTPKVKLCPGIKVSGRFNPTYAKGRAGKIGLGDAHAGAAGIGQRFRLGGAVTDLHAAKAPGQSATFNVTFTPTTSGSVVGAISVTAIVSSSEDSNINSNSPLSIPLSGTSISPPSVLQPTPSSISFGSVQVGNSTTQSGTLTNSGDSSVSITQANLTGAAFSVSGLSLPLTLIPGQSFTFGVAFTPNSAGSVTGSLSVVSNASNSPLAISLAGSGTAAGQVAVTPTTLDFGSIVVGTSTSLTGPLCATGSSVS